MLQVRTLSEFTIVASSYSCSSLLYKYQIEGSNESGGSFYSHRLSYLDGR